MKRELLEHLIRTCVCEVLDQTMNEVGDEIKGAAAPPAAGQGTADQPEIPKEPTTSPLPDNPQEMTGIYFVDPRNKSKLQKVSVTGTNDAEIERNLQAFTSHIAKVEVKIPQGTNENPHPTLRLVKDALNNPAIPTYLYLSKLDPRSEELYVMGAKSAIEAKNGSISPSEIMGKAAVRVGPDFSNTPGNEQPPQATIAEQQLKKAISKIVDEVLNRR